MPCELSALQLSGPNAMPRRSNLQGLTLSVNDTLLSNRLMNVKQSSISTRDVAVTVPANIVSPRPESMIVVTLYT